MPGLRLVNKDEKLTFVGDGFKIFYRRMPNSQIARIRERHTKRGDTNHQAVANDVLEWCVMGWSGVWDKNGDGKLVEIPFDSDKVGMIPDVVAAKIVDLVGDNADLEGVEAKNSKSSSGSKTKTTGSPASSAE